MAPALPSLGPPTATPSATLLGPFVHTSEALLHPLWFATASVLTLVGDEWNRNGGECDDADTGDGDRGITS